VRVDHLYVLPIFAALDGGPDKKMETERTAAALFRRHSPKSKTAALVAISNL